MTSGGLPHSGTRGSTPADGSPRLVAAFRALHRPSTPRHPPCARRSSAAMLAHDAEPTGSTHVHHSALVKDPRPSRASSEPSTATRAPDASHEPRSANQPDPNKKRPTVGPHHTHTREPLALHPPLLFHHHQRANRPAPHPRNPRGASHCTPDRPLRVKGSHPRHPGHVRRRGNPDGFHGD